MSKLGFYKAGRSTHTRAILAKSGSAKRSQMWALGQLNYACNALTASSVRMICITCRKAEQTTDRRCGPCQKS